MTLSRRHLLSSFLAAPLAGFAAPAAGRFKVSLAEWSIHNAIQKGKLTNLDFPRIAQENNCEGLEFVNTLWGSPTAGYIARLKRRMADTGTKPVLIMVDDEGMMGHSDKAQRMMAVKNHHKWVDAAAEVGCHSIRTNMYPEKQPTTPAEIEAFLGYCAESFTALCGYAKTANINIIIENHGGISSNPDVVLSLMKKVGLPNFGTLPDFGNFPKEIDRYAAVAKLMTYAKGASFKCHFDGAGGTEDLYDIPKMLKIVEASKYSGYIGIEFEGSKLDELEGIKLGRKALREYGV
ncbi:sugar phosphate isomerase/epimerase family protein [uncultured Paludibaculum sp.]|uniref:sugar phosphate isomerase/epimerase family protein n=1 Tax=uncultured Paludibaculum sp. TaxID=1765020 RepID=UPI002AAB2C6E|nr:sugar phosphate isomerase/epimerase family protein [uncultured Paludibaculum sp.]